MKEELKILGYRCKERVTGFKGVATSISFDLYGCIQVLLSPGLSEDGTLGKSIWFDYSRLKIISKKPVMEAPNFGDIEDKGPESKPVKL